MYNAHVYFYVHTGTVLRIIGGRMGEKLRNASIREKLNFKLGSAIEWTSPSNCWNNLRSFRRDDGFWHMTFHRTLTIWCTVHSYNLVYSSQLLGFEQLHSSSPQVLDVVFSWGMESSCTMAFRSACLAIQLSWHQHYLEMTLKIIMDLNLDPAKTIHFGLNHSNLCRFLWYIWTSSKVNWGVPGWVHHGWCCLIPRMFHGEYTWFLTIRVGGTWWTLGNIVQS